MESDSSLTDPSSSDLSSAGSRSPSLGYPSPISSQDLESLEPLSNEESKKRKTKNEDTPVPKKRKRAEPKPRTTETLDLTRDPQNLATEQKAQLDLLLKVLRKRRKIVVIAGAGISVSAGIPDFRSSTGLFKSLKSDHKLKASGKQLFDASVYQTDSSTSSFHDMVCSLSTMVNSAKPTAFHRMLSDLGTERRLMRLYTQNVDGIDVALPSLGTSIPLPQKGPWPRTVQLHGGLQKMVCSKCRTHSDFDPTLFNGPEAPACGTCIEADRVRTDHAGKRSHGVGRLRPRLVLYNEHNPDEEAIGGVMSADLRARPDAVIVVGTSMKIPGVRRIVREMCGVVRSRRDGLTVWINQEGPPPGKEFEDCWDLVVKGPCDEVAHQLDLSLNPHTECTMSDMERAMDDKKVEVQVHQSDVGMITPVASPSSRQEVKPPKVTLRLNPPKPHGLQGLKVGKATNNQSRNQKDVKKNKKNQTSLKEIKINRQFKTTKPKTYTENPAKKVSNIGTENSSSISHPMEPVSPSDHRNNWSPPMLDESVKCAMTEVGTESSSCALQSLPATNGRPVDVPQCSLDLVLHERQTDIPWQSGEVKLEIQEEPLESMSADNSFDAHMHSPTMVTSRPSTASSSRYEGTISPVSKPRGLEALID